MKRVGLCLLLYVGFLAPASARNSWDPMSSKPQPRQQGFLEWLFSRHNAQRANYGQKIENARQAVVDSFRSAEFWGQVIPWCWVAVLFAKFKHQDKVREQRLTISARLVARIYNALADARAQAVEAIRRHNELVDSLNLPSPNSSTTPQSVTADATAKRMFAQPRNAAASSTAGDRPQPKPTTSPTAREGTADVATSPAANQAANHPQNSGKSASESRVSSVEFVAQINALQGQVTALQETNKNKQNEIDRLQAENNSLKRNPNCGDKDSHIQ